jgi:hypothetical protein
MLRKTILSLQEKAKYCVTLVFETVVYLSKLLGFIPPRRDKSLVFALFLSKPENEEFSF